MPVHPTFTWHFPGCQDRPRKPTNFHLAFARRANFYLAFARLGSSGICNQNQKNPQCFINEVELINYMKTSGSWKTTISQRRAQPGNPGNPRRKARRLPGNLENTWQKPGVCQGAEHQNLNTSYGSGGIPEAGKSLPNAIPGLATRKTPG